MEIRRILYAVVRKWWLIILLAGIGGGIGYYLNVFLSHPIYSADTKLYVLNLNKVQTGQILNTQDIALSQQLVKQYSGIFYSRSVTSAAAKALVDYNITERMLASMIQLSNQEDSNILTITARAPDPVLAAAVANAMGNEFNSLIRTLTKSDYIGILDEAQVPLQPIPSNGMKKALLWMLAGVVLALAIIYVIEYFDTRVRSAEEIEKVLELNVIGIIPEYDIR
jgi:capsular polysaccharide biosynthesis protein